MTHTYKTTHSRHDVYHGLRFSVAALMFAVTIWCFTVHWILGLVSILPMMIISGTINSFLNARATYLYLNCDCGVTVTYAEARKYDHYSPPMKRDIGSLCITSVHFQSSSVGPQ